MKKEILIAQVILDHYHAKLDHLFDYLIPEHMQTLIQPGMQVTVPFGRNNRLTEAFVMSIKCRQKMDQPLKELAHISEEAYVMTAAQIEMVRWMKKSYLCRYIEGIRCFVPNHRTGKKKVIWVHCQLESEELAEQQIKMKRAPMQQKVLEALQEIRHAPLASLLKMTGAPNSAVKALAAKGFITISEEITRRNPFKDSVTTPYPEPRLTHFQERAMMLIRGHWEKKPEIPVLLHGITGSGKTEIYLQLIKRTLAQQQDSILLVPEIALTPQMVQRFRGRFGDQVAVLHSHLSEGEKLDEWGRIRRGEARIVIGPRSAIFAPCQNLGIIIIDEEHEHTYKSEQAPRYHATEIARQRCRLEKAQLLLGSATPSLESYHEAEHQKILLVELKERAAGGRLPQVEVVDLRKEAREGNRTLFSRSLIAALEHCLGKKHQAILLLNRRAFATLVMCPQCGYVAKCSQCDISMKWHRKERVLKCHYCGRREPVPESCPMCGELVSFQGAGTQKVEEGLQLLFPDHVVARMDQDVTRQKGSHQAILERFEAKEIDLLVGTQMIAKGLDFPNVTVVGILLADTSLNLPDFRAAEKTFQLMTQVAGRAGRGMQEGKVILQTFQPDHYAVHLSAIQDYHRFYQEEMQIRQRFLYPPFSRLIQVTFWSESEEAVAKAAHHSAAAVRFILEKSGYGEHLEEVMEPGPALIAKIENRYRYTLLMKSVKIPFHLMRKTVKYLLMDGRDRYISPMVTVTVDPDPRIVG
ncbi:replication restart helicase PriA [Anoxynatronum buryatiense]|uniref:Replication restart protein PriA n=1 Tax=Anoxynatronum buryatiense TaxID=489973 RepID=A0AA46AI99_9CLOT|nr:primosomal protein N' [Anoxynatronum buryatiense]SMP46869.1 replication restart DNA helicase PriA [Anoxynatronum buryatiense]